MNKDEATQKWIADHTMGDLKPHDGAVKCFREGYEAGQRAERERIIQRLSQIDEAMDGPDAFIYRVCEFIDELRADSAESGE